MKLVATSSLRAQLDRECRHVFPELYGIQVLTVVLEQMRADPVQMTMPKSVVEEWAQRQRIQNLSPSEKEIGAETYAVLESTTSERLASQMSRKAAPLGHVVPEEALSASG